MTHITLKQMRVPRQRQVQVQAQEKEQEQQQGHSNPDGRRFSLAMILPRYLFIMQIGMIGGFGLMIAGMVGLGQRYINLRPNPFTAYADILPGEPSGGLAARGFTCSGYNYNYYQSPTETHCGLNPESGAFDHIEVVILDGVIHVVMFEVHPYTFNVGELAVWLELSEIRPHRGILFSWNGNVGIARVINSYARFSLLHYVWQVTLTDTRRSLPG
jgi:hypothetical protein